MITTSQQLKLFEDVARVLPRRITVYAIGGTAMMFHGLKDETLDIDLVFTNKEDRETFKNGAKSLGFSEMDARVVYRNRDNIPEMIKLGEVRFDLFVLKVISTNFSEQMQNRASVVHEFCDKLIVRVADVRDIIVMKAVTGREKDDLDMERIMKNNKINWDTIYEEVIRQVESGNERAIIEVGYAFERFRNRKVAVIPKQFLDKLWKLLTKQIKGKAKKI